VYKWILPSLEEVVTANQATVVECSSAKKAHQQWRMSLAAAEQMLWNNVTNATQNTIPGLVLTGPVPVFSHPQLTHHLRTITFTAKPFNPLALMPFQMPSVDINSDTESYPQESVLPLLPVDPLADEQFCLIFTEQFSLLLVLTAEENGRRNFLFSFEPQVIQQAWQALGARVMLTNPTFFANLELLVKKYTQIPPDYRQILQFSQWLLTYIPEPELENLAKEQGDEGYITANVPSHQYGFHQTEPLDESLEHSQSANGHHDVELLQAFAHEVRTPLTTIRTMTRLLLRQKDLPENVIKRLKIIDRECTEQIDRMELLFQAAELETCNIGRSLVRTPLTAMSLDQVLRQNIPRWQETATRRNLTLEVVLPQHLPTVVSNPVMLDRVLTGVMENVTRNLPPGSRIQVQVIPAGNQLKLQLLPLPQSQEEDRKSPCTPPIRKALGQLLTFQPETGTISLNLSATKHLFQEIGGKLIVRQRPQHGEVLTIFLPLEIKEKQPLGMKS
jgi:signal transduction histidine kinase